MSAVERPGTDVILPSKGLPYNGALPSGLITVYSMTTNEEKMFAGITKKIDFENVIDSLIRHCTGLPESVRPDELYVGDRVYLMMNIRAVSYGSQYGFKISCPECAIRWDHEIDVTTDLEVREVASNHEDPFKVTLPLSRDVITLRLFRGADERSIIKFIDQQNKKVNIRVVGDPGYTFRLSLHLVGVESSSDPQLSFDAEACAAKPGSLSALSIEYIERLNAQDSSAIRQEIDDRTPGMALAMELDCPKCNAHFELGLPLTADFFRSKSAAGSRTSARVVPRSA